MTVTEVKKGVYWVGAIDWSLRSFHGYATPRGSTYNAYLILDEKVTLIDTVKASFSDQLLSRISRVIDPSKIDYIVCNHVEMDHSGALPAMMKSAPNAKIFTSSPQGVKGLIAHYGEYPYVPVKAGESLCIGSRTLQFVPTPMLHWPDNMVTYCPEEKILFSNDAFGQHYASTGRFDDQEPLDAVLLEARKYYANIVMPYPKQAQAAYKTAAALDVEIIAPSHGVMWRGASKEILALYDQWSRNQTDGSAVVVFDSMWHSTEKMAMAITEAFAEKGVSAKLLDLKENHISEILTDILTAQYIAVGSPTLNNQMLPSVSAFLTYLKGLAPKGRKAFAFGSYGWSGQSIGQVEEQLKACGFELMMDKQRLVYVPTDQQLSALTDQVKACV